MSLLDYIKRYPKKNPQKPKCQPIKTKNTKPFPICITDKYQSFFNFMSKNHNLLLTINEMDEIISEAIKTKNKF